MRKYLVISVSLLVFLLFSSKKCDSPEDENAAREEIAFKATLDSINKVFEADYLSEQSLRAFELKAKQKLTDLADYLQIYCDPSLNGSFRDHTREMILDLFLSDSIHIMLQVSDEMKERDMTINEFLKLFPVPAENSTGFIFDSVVLSESLHRVSEFIYAGSLEFSRRYGVHAGTPSGSPGSVRKNVDIIAAKIGKQFGRDTLQIWQIYLGDIR
jgi:hypothetical protein